MAMKAGGGIDELNAEINVTPMVDVMLVLLIIFMITAPMMSSGVDLELPQVTTQKAVDAQGKLILSIDKNRVVTLRSASDKGTPILWKDLEARLKANERLKSQKSLYVEGDAHLPYAVVVTAMAIATNAGVEKVMLLTDPADNFNVDDLDKPAH